MQAEYHRRQCCKHHIKGNRTETDKRGACKPSRTPADYEDYLRVRNLEQWDINSPKFSQARSVCAKQNDSKIYRQAIEVRSAETIANITITLIHQTDTLLGKLIKYLKKDFIENGGIREEMYKARSDWNRRNKK